MATNLVTSSSQSTSGDLTLKETTSGLEKAASQATLGSAAANSGDQSITSSSQAALSSAGSSDTDTIDIQGNLSVIVTGDNNGHHVPAAIDDIEADVLISLDTKYSADAPDYAMENGAYTSDSLLKKPMELTAVMLFAEKPVTYKNRHSGRTIAEIRSALQEKYFAGELVKFTTPYDVYENMAITSLSMPQNDYLDAIQVSVTLKYINVTSAEMSEYDYDGASDSADSTSTTESGASVSDLVA